MNNTTSISIRVNGEPAQVPDGSTVGELVASQGLLPTQVAVEINKLIVPRAKHGETLLSADDRVEIVTMVGGG